MHFNALGKLTCNISCQFCLYGCCACISVQFRGKGSISRGGSRDGGIEGSISMGTRDREPKRIIPFLLWTIDNQRDPMTFLVVGVCGISLESNGPHSASSRGGVHTSYVHTYICKYARA